MKYIRTKDALKEFEFEWEHHTGQVFIKLKNQQRSISPDEIISRADTIEELCDGYVITREKDFFILHRLPYIKEHCINGNETVYGFIKTDKGLIYVAKINEKGELELL